MDILLIENCPGDARQVLQALGEASDCRTQWVDNLPTGLARLREGGIDVLLLAIDEPDRDQSNSLELICSAAPSVPVVALSRAYKAQSAIAAIKSGAQDYMAKSHLTGEQLAVSLRHSIERKQAEETHRRAIREVEAKLRGFSFNVLQSRDGERQRIAQELHNSPAQLIAALAMKLSLIKDSARDGSGENLAFLEASNLAYACSEEIRKIMYLLHPPSLEEMGGLRPALQSYVQRFGQRTGIQIELKMAANVEGLDAELEMVLFRMAREGLFNVYRHSESPLAVLRLERNDHEVRLILQDWGCGLSEPLSAKSPDVTEGCVGVWGMDSCAREFGGRLELTTSETGARLQVFIPLPAVRQK